MQDQYPEGDSSVHLLTTAPADWTATGQLDRIQAMLDGIGDGFYAIDRNWCITVINRAAEQLLGVTRDAVLGRTLWDTFPRAHGGWFEAAVRRCMADGEAVRVEVPAANEPSRLREVHIYSLPDGVAICVRDVTQARADQEALRESRDRLRLAQEAGRIGHWELELDTDLLWWSDSQFRLLGMSPSRSRRRVQEFRDMIHPADRMRADAAAERAVRDGVAIDLEFRITLPTGEMRWLAARGEVVRDGAGRPRSIIGINFDVTERRRAEERQKLLTAEVDHRAKNLLGVIQAILRMSRADSVDAMVTAVEGRVDALAAAHTLLAQGRWSGAPLARLAELGLRTFVGQGHTLAVSGPTVMLTASAVQGLGLLFHELGTNAVKYGALSVPGGRVDLLWSHHAGEGVRLRWRETGGPPVVAPRHRGFGSHLIEQIVRHQLGAVLTIDWLPEGLLVEALLPGSCLADPADEAPQPSATSPAVPAADVDLRGRRVLVVEDDAVIALEVEMRLRSSGVVVVGPASDLAQGLRLAAAEELDAAVLDISLHRDTSAAIAELLRARGVPFLFCTGYGADSLPEGLGRGEPVLRKPLRRGDLEGGLKRILGASTATEPPR